MSDFSLHPQLKKDCLYIGKMHLCHVLLLNNAYFRWFILVPEVEEKQLSHLSIPDRAMLHAEVQHISERMEHTLCPDKMNTGAIGILVPQLHFHVVARYESDLAWPGVVWGFKETLPYEEDLVQEMIEDLDFHLQSISEAFT